MKKYIITTGVVYFILITIAGAQGFTFESNLSVNSTGGDVSNLQTWLIENGYDIPAISSGLAAKGFFGSQTRAAVVRYQAAHGIPNTGYFGPLTRGRINGTHNSNNGPVINSVSGPTSLKTNVTGTWTVNATNLISGPLSYSVIWGDEAQSVSAPNAGESALYRDFTQSTTFTHSYSNSGVYTIRFAVRDVTGKVVTKNVTVNVGNVGGSLKVTSPNGGESWKIGTSQNVTWTSPLYIRATYADIRLIPYNAPCTSQVCPMDLTISSGATSSMYPYRNPYTIAKNININQNSYSWTVGVIEPDAQILIYPAPIIYAQAGQYTIQICETNTSNCESSDAPFTIYASTSNNQSPVISGIDAPTALSLNQRGTWTVRATDPENSQLSYSVDWGDVLYPQTLTMDSGVSREFSQSTSFTHSYNTSGMYTVTFTVRDNLGLTAQTRTTVNVQ